MRVLLAATLLLAVEAFAPRHAFRQQTRCLAKKEDEGEVVVQIQALAKGTVVEFVHNKHTMLGVVEDHMVKAKGGLRYEIKTADEKVHAGVAPKDINFSAAGAKKQLAAKADVLDTAAPLLVDAELLELAYEVAAEDDQVLRVKDVAALLDAGSDPVDLYRTFRVLSNELGKVFFAKAKGEAAAFKVRAKKTVEAAKQSLCGNAGDDYADFCLV
mmetsp:Transcript_17810/g.54794  ORF Transcript_17810/g.54794 Transcript_17810/m.54794 type:complete len:214 (-) Transcript_17810:105-746(-)